MNGPRFAPPRRDKPTRFAVWVAFECVRFVKTLGPLRKNVEVGSDEFPNQPVSFASFSPALKEKLHAGRPN